MTGTWKISGGTGLGALDVCPGCQYSLRGLPAEHCCPECGFRYDRDARVFSRARLGLFVFGLASALLIVAGVVMRWWFGSWMARGMAPLYFAPMGVMGVLATAWRLRMSGRFILLSRDELRVFDNRHRERAFLMNRIADAEYSRVDGSVKITGFDGRELIFIGREFLGSRRRSKRLASLINGHVFATQAGYGE